MKDYELVATAMRRANPWPEESASAEGEWSRDELLSNIEHRSDTTKTAERDIQPLHPSGPSRSRGLMVAAAAFAVVLLVGAALFALVANRPDTDVVQPPPTTLPAPTTVPPPTTPSPTTPSPTTVSTTTPATTAAPEVSEPQTYDATLTWDGQTCTFDGPTEARVGDTLNLTGVNDSTQFAFFLVLYMTSGTTIDDANHHFDNVLGNVLNDNTAGWLRPTDSQPDMVPPPEYVLVQEADDIRAGGSFAIRSQGFENLRLLQPREHMFVCSSADTNDRTDDRLIDNAAQTIRVSE